MIIKSRACPMSRHAPATPSHQLPGALAGDAGLGADSLVPWRANLRWCMQDCGSGNCQRTAHAAGLAEVTAHRGDDMAGGTMATTTRPTKIGAADSDGAR